MATITEQRAEVAGVETFWRRAEPDAGRAPAVFVHGVPVSSDIWVPFLEGCGGIALDLPGFGRSGKPGDFDYSIPGYDRFLGAFVDHLALERFSLVVHGWGGGVALPMAQRMPQRLERLVVFGSTPLLPGYRWHRVARLWRIPLVGEITMGFSGRFAMRRGLRASQAAPDRMPEELVDSVMRHFDHGTQRAILRLHRSAPPETLERRGRDLGQITAPALILFGRDDPYIPERFGAAYAEALGGKARLEVVEGAGHWSWLDRPELVETATRFLAE